MKYKIFIIHLVLIALINCGSNQVSTTQTDLEDLTNQVTDTLNQLDEEEIEEQQPVIINFFGISASATQGSPFTLVWDVDNADTVTIDNGIGSVDTTGQSVFTPNANATQITFNITASKTDSFTTTQSLTVYLGSTEDGQDPSDGVDLVWNPISGATGYTIELYDTTDCSGTAIQTTTSTTASVSVSDLETRSLYSYKVLSGGVEVFACQQIAVGDTGLVGWWKFNEGEGTTSSDLSGQGHDATLDESQWASDSAEGLAVSFDGVDDVVEIADSGFFTSADDFSFEFWVKADSTVASDAGILTTSSGIETTTNNGARIKTGTVSEYEFEFAPGFNSYGDYGASDNKDYLSEWKHIVLTHSSEGVWTFYINGHRVRRVTDEHDFTNDGLNLGRYNDGASFYYFTGLVDELVAYNRVLSTLEIRNNCQLNDDGGVCAADDVPEMIYPINGKSYANGRIYYEWNDISVPEGLSIEGYQYCLEDADFLSSQIVSSTSCPTGVLAVNQDEDETFRSEDLTNYTLTGDNVWFKVRTKYDDGSFSEYSNTVRIASDDDLRGWWKFDSISAGYSPNELSSYPDAYQGSRTLRPVTGGSSCNGQDIVSQNGGAACFDGNDDYMVFYTSTADIVDDNYYDLSETVTVVARVLPTGDSQEEYMPIFSRWNDFENKREYMLNTSNIKARAVAYPGGAVSQSLSSEYSQDGWQFLILTYDDRYDNQPDLYVNGVLDNNEVDGTQANVVGQASSFGVFYSAVGQYVTKDSAGAIQYEHYKGAIDEIIVMDRKIDAEEALNIYCAFEAEIASSDSTYEMPDVCSE